MKQTNEKISTEYYIGNSRKNEWSTVYFYSPQIPAIYEDKGEIFAAISLSGPPSFDANMAGNLLLDQLHEQYFEADEPSALLCLEKAVLEVRKRLLELLQNDEVSSIEGIEMHIVTMVKKDDNGYLVTMGEAKIFGLRDEELADITSVLRDPDGKNEIKIGSLKINKGDKFILTTPEGDFEFNKKEKEKGLTDFSLETLEAKYLANEALVSILLVGNDLEEVIDEEIEVNTIEKSVEASLSSRRDHLEDFESSFDETKEELYNEKINGEEGVGEEVIDDKKNSEEVELNKRSKGVATKATLKNVTDKLKNIKSDENAQTFKVITAKTVETVGSGTKKGVEYLKKDILKMGDQGRVYSRGKSGGRNWRPIVFFGLVFVVVSYLIISTVKNNAEQKQLKLAAELSITDSLEKVSRLEEQVGGLVNTYDRIDEKGEIINEINMTKASLSEIEHEEFNDQKSEQINSLSELERRVSRTIKVTEPKVIRDFGIVEGSVPNDIEISGDKIFVSDSGLGVIYAMDYDGGNSGRIADGLENPISIAYSSLNELVFVDQDSDRVMGVINLADQSLKRLPGISNSRLGEINDIDAYQVSESDHRAYAVRNSSNEVVQMRRGSSGYGLPDLRLSDQGFGTLRDIEVNGGRIYVLSEGQGVRSFYGDSEIPFDVRGMTDGSSWSMGTNMYIDNRYIYVVDSTNQKIMVFTKGRGSETSIIDFVAQYDLSGVGEIGELKDVVTNEVMGDLFVISNTKVFRLSLSDIKEFEY